MKKQLLLLCMLLGFLSTGFSQTVSIINKKFVVNGNVNCPIYFNGANTPWDNWNDFGGNYDAAFWSTHFATLKANGINASRVWISCNGDVQPNINSDGTVTGVSTQFWANVDNFFQSAQANGIYIMATMMSFDHTKNTYNKYQSWRNMLNDQTKVQTYCDNYLVPFVNRYKSNPYLMSIDISNEIEWVAEDANNMKCSYAVLQRFVAMCASAIHNNQRTDGSTVLVTLGSAATKWNATKMRIGANGAWSQNNSDGNKWSDAALKAQYNQANAILDYYSPHYYSWIDQYYSNPFERTPADFGMDDKAVLIGETPAGNPGTPNLSPLASYEAVKNNGYQGHFPWTSNGVDAIGGISKFGADAKTFATTYSALVYPTCSVVCATVVPTVTTPVVYCKGATAIALTATGTDLKWYADNTTTTALTGAPTPSTATAGTINYYVSQTLNGCEGPRALIAVTVNALPTVTISSGGSTIFCQGGSVTLTSSAGTGYQWNNAAGPITGATTATYSAAAMGSYSVKVTNANNCSATSTATTVTVNALPIASISTTTSTTFCSGESIVLTSSPGSSYKWFRGTTQVATTPTHTALAPGNYTVEVTNANGCKATSSAITVTINSVSIASINTLTPTTFCAGGSVLLTSSFGSSYKWFRNGLLVGNDQTYLATEAGSYKVEVVSTNNCVTTSPATMVIVHASPTATITAGGSTTICQGESVTLTSSTGTAYQWSNAAGPISGATNATYNAITAGSYTVKVTNANNCSATSAATTVIVNAVPIATITTTTPTTFCQGGSITLTASPGTLYQWNNIAGIISGATNSTHIATTSGAYTVKVTNASNCSTTSTARIVTVNALPAATISTTTSTTICAGGSVLLTANAGSAYKWFRGTTQVGTGQTYLATAAGNYTVEVTNSSTCSATSAATIVTINAVPLPIITTTTPTTFCEGGSVLMTSSPGSSYKWFRGTTTQVATTQTYSATVSGNYTVEVTNANNCVMTSLARAVIVNPLPTATISTSTSTTFCAGGSVLLTASNGSSYMWFRGTTQLTATQTYSATVAGNYTVEVTNANNCTALSAVTTVTVLSGVTWYQDLDGDGKGDETVTQTSCTQPTGYVSVAGDACPADANKLTPGSCGCGNAEANSDSDQTPDCIDADDDNDGIADVNDCAPFNASIGAASVWYQDSDGDGNGNAAVTQTACNQPTGYVPVAGDACPTDANKITPGICGCSIAEGACTDCNGVVNGTASLDVCNICSGGTTGIVPSTNVSQCDPVTAVQNGLSTDLQVYPNPYEDELYIEVANGEFTVVVYNVSGVEVLRGTYSQQAMIGSQLPEGIYMVRVEQNGVTDTRKVIKK